MCNAVLGHSVVVCFIFVFFAVFGVLQCGILCFAVLGCAASGMVLNFGCFVVRRVGDIGITWVFVTPGQVFFLL